MPETGGANIEIAQQLNEGKAHSESTHSSAHEIVEIIEAIVLAIVAISTAWSGYQAALWDGTQTLLYGQSSKLRILAETAETIANQERMYDGATVVEWLKAEAHKDTELATIFERRLLPEFLPAFTAWKKTDPLHNPNAPAGPTQMPEYRSAKTQEALKLNQQSSDLFDEGTRAREHAEGYVRSTVTLATVLLLTAISQRFRSHRIRVGLVILAFLVLCIPLWRLFVLPRL